MKRAGNRCQARSSLGDLPSDIRFSQAKDFFHILFGVGIIRKSAGRSLHGRVCLARRPVGQAGVVVQFDCFAVDDAGKLLIHGESLAQERSLGGDE